MAVDRAAAAAGLVGGVASGLLLLAAQKGWEWVVQNNAKGKHYKTLLDLCNLGADESPHLVERSHHEANIGVLTSCEGAFWLYGSEKKQITVIRFINGAFSNYPEAAWWRKRDGVFVLGDWHELDAKEICSKLAEKMHRYASGEDVLEFSGEETV